MGVLLLTSEAQVRHAMTRADYLLQQYLGDPQSVLDHLARVEREGIPLVHTFQGIKRSLQAMIGPDGNVEHILCTHNRMTGYNARSIVRDHDPEALLVARQCARVFAQAGWRGPLNIQCQPAADGRLLIHEFNGRFTGATGARWAMGHDEVGMAVRLFAGHDLDSGFTWETGPVAAFEHLAARAADPSAVRRLAESGEWTRDAPR
jgi:carbamoyl-phosphate synthase large subunit